MNSNIFYKFRTLIVVCVFFLFPERSFAQSTKSAQVECGSDRRCRLARLKRLQETRRRHAYNQERYARNQGTQMAESEYLKKNPRRRDPFSFGARFSRVGFFGFGVGYQFADAFRAQFSYQRVSILNFSGSRTIELNANQFGLAGEYFLSTGGFAPFLSGGFFLMEGEAGTDFYSSVGGLGESTAALHFAELGGGFDIQVNGYRFRLMGAFKPLIYHQGTINGAHDESTKESLKQTFESDMQIDIILQLGYAF